MTQHNESHGVALAVGQCPVCGSAQALEPYKGLETVRVGDFSEELTMTGERCRVCEETFADAGSTARWASVSNALVAKVRKARADELKRIREALGLTQAAAALLTGGGHNAFSRYERGEAEPLPAVFNLFKLLDKHPDLLAEVAPQLASKVRVEMRGKVSVSPMAKRPALVNRVMNRKALEKRLGTLTASGGQVKVRTATGEVVTGKLVAGTEKKGPSPKTGALSSHRSAAPVRR